ncbi:Arginine decarboxylase [Caloramator mitchellensis]|uniref:Arginine decarboxylase n=1 Tax=Caloramator mitchellensis TaxID=908809 RepID=A0A0R3JTC1_CALMK|nr:aminotransferase class I/II-fold pyridoxal phosphate-dependent enzyme [Caloramator mitchellensis]KRQ86771.1 Arginine decarboxylase [Caloramator mitchellensis]
MDTPILNGLLDYAMEENIPFHMPGHKNNKRGFSELEKIKDNLFSIDLTEVEGVDNLHNPEAMIKEGQIKLAKALGANESFILVNGSTSGVYSMILGLTKPKDKILIQRNCHRSVYMAAFLGDLEVEYINPTIIDEFNIPVSISIDEIISKIEKNKDAKAIVITYPTYYGTCADLGKIIEAAHKNGMYVLVDEAHGAHFGFSKLMPKTAMELGADVSVNSFHKTLPSLTQTAVLNVNKGVPIEGIKFMLRLFQSTSPSYIFMASVDVARFIMEKHGEGLMEELLENINKFKERIDDLKEFKVLDEKYIGKADIHDIDRSRIVINSYFGGKFLDGILRKEYNIQVEMADLNNIVLIGSISDKAEFYDKIYMALKDIAVKYKGSINKNVDMKCGFIDYKKAMSIKEAYYKEKRSVKIENAVGCISGEFVIPYPPGVPILVPGEIITKDILELITIYKENGISIVGIEDSSCDTINIL